MMQNIEQLEKRLWAGQFRQFENFTLQNIHIQEARDILLQ